MTTCESVPYGKPDAGNPHVAPTPRCGITTKCVTFGYAALVASLALAMTEPAMSGSQGGTLRPPAVPLAVNDPQLSLWSAGDRLTDTNTMHWCRAAQPLAIVGEAGGRIWRFCGTEPADVPAAKQLSVKVGCTETVYRFDAGGEPVEIRFSTPLLPGAWDVFSRPVTYVTVKGAKAKVAISPALATNDDSAEMVTNRTQIAGCAAVSIARKVQPKPSAGDRVRPNWGTAWLLDAGDHFLLAYDSVFDFSFLGEPVPAWWRRPDGPYGANFRTMLERAVADYSQLMRRMAAFDAEMRAKFVRVGGEKYADMAELAWRQSFGAGKLAAAKNGDMLYFSKENTSNGCIATIDILYPQLPHLMLGGVELAKAAIRPDMIYAASGKWPYPYAPHDLGSYPFADAQRYGMWKGATDSSRMPVEESGNLILALYAVARMEGRADFADAWWPTLCQWAAYLERFGFDPAEQLCTDDFAGHLARNANLSIKTITAFEAFARLAAMRGDSATAARYHALATDGASKWLVEAAGGKDGATTLAFGAKGTWSLKYNLAFAKALGIDLFPADVARREVAAYLKNADRFGIPLDSRKHWCKVDWLVWCATLTETRADFEAMVAPTWKFLNETTERVAFPDLYYTENAMCTRYGAANDRFIGFNARPVIGGIYLPLLRPTLETRTFVSDVTKFGARTDAAPAVNAAAIQKAIDAAAAAPGGGRVVVPAGEWVSGTIWLRSGVELHLEKGAVLKASPNLADYNREDAYPENFGCPKSEYWRGFHFIICRCAENVSITGEGTIHGNGDVFFDEKPVNYSWNPPTAPYWWDGIRWSKDKVNLRPGQLVVFVRCGHLLVDGITIRNSPCWSMFFYGCHDVTVRNYTVRNGFCDANADGIDIDCCKNVLVEDVDIETGDDGLTVRGAGRHLGLDPQPPCENVVVRRAKLKCSSSVFRIGVGDGLIRNVTVEDVTSGRGGTAINLNACYGSKETGGVDMENIVFRRCRFDNCREAYNIHAAGRKQTFGIRNVIFEDVSFPTNVPRHVGADKGSPAPSNVLMATGKKW